MPDELMRAHHAELNVVHLVPDNDYYRSLGWSKVDDDVLTTSEEVAKAEGEAFTAALVESGAVFDPGAHTVAEVKDYLAGDVTEDERARVLDAERAGQARKSLLED